MSRTTGSASPISPSITTTTSSFSTTAHIHQQKWQKFCSAKIVPHATVIGQR
uniref:Candidate secreted effector n=1 Tax=Meloidogyne incognita TaxID=6306 RepID=A0A914MEA6_MELIC